MLFVLWEDGPGPKRGMGIPVPKMGLEPEPATSPNCFAAGWAMGFATDMDSAELGK